MNSAALAHKDAGKNDYIHGDEHLVDDTTVLERAAEYAKQIYHDSCESANLATELLESGAIEPLIAISRTDPAHTGTLFAQIVSDLIDRKADLLSENDSGELIEFERTRDFQSYEMQFDAARERVRKRGL